MVVGEAMELVIMAVLVVVNLGLLVAIQKWSGLT